MPCPGGNPTKTFCFFAACYTGGESSSALLAGPISLGKSDAASGNRSILTITGDVLNVDVSAGAFKLAE